ncbi:MAG: anion transporter [Methanomicrobiales archaeon HGW-Methanomicrobiales-1]|nr:MAG: anion transporter [Methanomicrobiales archaeon HGW-Methanomicrobiales-1]
MVLAAVFLLIAVRQVGRFTLKIWQIMLGGAVAVLVTGQIALPDALRAINPDVMLFLFGMFVVGEALVESGYLASIAHRFFSPAKNPDQLVLMILFGMGLLSALLMNDTLAIIGTPLVLALATRFKLSPSLLLITLAVAITTGSVMSPIGNPQNLLIAQDSGMTTAFVTFGSYLLIPTLISLLLAFVVLRLFYKEEFSFRPVPEDPITPCDPSATLPVRCSLAIILLLAATNIAASLLGARMIITLPLIALGAAAPVLLLSERRWTVLRGIDWATLVFFAAMFVLMESVWQTGFFQSFVGGGMVSSVPMILGTSVLISQFISNVPFVALFQPMILQAGGGATARLMALAAGSTIAGNLTILGAASNVIIIQNAEKQGRTISFMEFAKVGIPVTILQLFVYGIFLSIL